MTLQDKIDGFQKLIFAHIPHTAHSECRISALVPLVQESYGIYKFITNMLRAMHQSVGDDEILSPLRQRYDMQHYRLVKFYYECSQLRYLTSLITVPRLPGEPPNLLAEEDEKPGLPSRAAKEIEKPPTPVKVPDRVPSIDPEPIGEFWKNQDAYAEEQRRLQEQLEAERRQQEERERLAQMEFERQQRVAAEQQRAEQERLAQQLQAQQTYGRLAELEQENLAARARYEQDQLMLQQYDRKLKALENELMQLQSNYQQQTSSKDDQIRALQEEVNTWRKKYEALAKLYQQLRNEHLELLQKFKGVQTKAASAQEAIDQREKLQRELKQKNLDLANMLRERDRALLDKDRVTGGHKEELDKLNRELRFAREQAENADRAKGSELSAMLNRHNREIADLEEALRQKTRQMNDLRSSDEVNELRRQLSEKEDQIEILHAGMDQTLLELDKLKQMQDASDQVIDGQLDSVILDHVRKINDLIDSVLQSGVHRVDDAIYELDSSMQAGNQSASGAYVLSQIEKAQQNAMEFSTAFREFIADGPNNAHSEIIRTVNIFAGSIEDVLRDTKGLTRFASDDRKGDQLTGAARKAAQATIKFFRDLQSFRLTHLDDDQKQDVIIHNNGDVQLSLQTLSKLADAFAPKSKITDKTGDLGDLVDSELTKAAAAIDAATERLNQLMNKPRDSYSTYELKIHDSILEAAIAVTNAIARLIKAATASQQEIVREGKGTSSRAAFYKKHNRWTEGLISAAKAVANSTNMLIETADGVISGRNSPEQLIVASNDVAASTAQLVAASRVKASLMSKTQENLEAASRAVTSACRGLVRQVQDIIAMRNREDGEAVDYGKLTSHELKTREMEQQVRFFRFSLVERVLTNYMLGRNLNPREQLKSCKNEAGRDEKIGLSGRLVRVIIVSLLCFGDRHPVNHGIVLLR
jgi:huntingtin-interacting protein 1-related protein